MIITSNVVHRVLKIRAGEATGTAFTIEHDNRQYVITARHLVDHLRPPHVLDVYLEGKGWSPIALELTGLSSEADVAVFSAGILLTPTYDLEPTSKGLMYGQDVSFIGFPYDIMGFVGDLNRGLPLPLVKRASVSAFAKGETGIEVFLLDGHNNHGFSGAPVVYHPRGSSDPGELKVCGIISGYYKKPVPTPVGNPDARVMLWQNTGVILCIPIIKAVRVIEANPNGVEVEV